MSDKWSGFDLYYISCSYSEGMNQFLFLVMQIQVSEQQTILVSHFHITPCDALQKKVLKHYLFLPSGQEGITLTTTV